MSQNKILIIHQGATGDLVLSLPSLYIIRNYFPKHHFEVCGHTHILELIHNRFYADSIRSANWSAMTDLYSKKEKLSTDLQNYFEQFDAVFLFGVGHQKTVADKLKKNLKSTSIFFIPSFPPEKTIKHVTTFQHDVLAGFGFRAKTGHPKLFILQKDRHEARDFLKTKGLKQTYDPLIAIHPGSGNPRKNWPPENYVKLAKYLNDTIKAGFIIIEGPADKLAVENYKNITDPGPGLVLKNKSLVFTASITSQADMFIGNDSGITHIAASLGIRTVALFGPTDPEIWGPRGSNVKIVRKKSVKNIWEWPCPEEVADKILSQDLQTAGEN